MTEGHGLGGAILARGNRAQPRQVTQRTLPWPLGRLRPGRCRE
ncbi:hypothetical protein HMPREF9946_03245 [Acetobacteraceae bacterium AT-5844]|nr:hypothetical protein HMPREF9946_03245 [Acetobacteraceae bacterium AT-5844]